MINNVSDNKDLPRIFFFTGLGADERAFAYLKIKTSLPKFYVSWLKPGIDEDFGDYCQRLAKELGIKNGDILIGLSFGGLVVTEINKFIKPALSILISSASTRKELPLIYRAADRVNLHYLIPKSSLNKPNRLRHFLFGLKKPAQRKLFDEIVTHTDPDFVRWAMDKIVHWKNSERPENLFKIHGTSDRIIPIHKASSDFIIKGGSHFLTWENAAEVSAVISMLMKAKGLDTGE